MRTPQGGLSYDSALAGTSDGLPEQTPGSSFVFVAVDEDREPTDVPDLGVESDRCRDLREAALADDRGG